MAPPILLIHGAWHGAWCWEKTLALLPPSTRAIDLPGGGPNRPGWGVGLDDVARATCDAAREMGGNVAVAGHSLGGAVISRAAELAPELFAGLIYVTAFLLRPGQSAIDVANTDKDSKVPTCIQPAPLSGLIKIKREEMKPVFYNDLPPAEQEANAKRATDQSIRTLIGKAKLSDSRWGSRRRFYISCLQDHAISPACHQRMVAATPVEEFVTLDASHSPFASKPQDTAQLIMGFANKL